MFYILYITSGAWPARPANAPKALQHGNQPEPAAFQKQKPYPGRHAAGSKK